MEGFSGSVSELQLKLQSTEILQTIAKPAAWADVETWGNTMTLMLNKAKRQRNALKSHYLTLLCTPLLTSTLLGSRSKPLCHAGGKGQRQQTHTSPLSSARALAAEEAAHALDATVFVVETVLGGRGDGGFAQQKASALEEWTGSCSNPPSVALLTALSSLLLTYLHHLELFAPLAVSLSFCIPPCVRTQLCPAETFQ